jgi:5-methyltetrahydrofolate--homocysteine methyltransferase
MRTLPNGGTFTIIGENIHATRVLLTKGSQVVLDGVDRPGVRFTDAAGAPRLLPLPDEILASDAFRNGKVKHVRAALLAAQGDDPAAVGEARAYIAHLVSRQVAAGADYLDLNVDEIAPDVDRQCGAMRWLVETVEDLAPGVPVSLDSSSTEVIAAGLAASRRPDGPPMLNSASVERLDVLDLGAKAGSPLVVTAAGRGAMPSDTAERVANATEIVEAALGRGIPVERLHVDPLVLPVAVDPGHGVAYLEAVRTLRSRFGPAIHITGGLSNVSFGLPARRLLNDVFIALAVEAGADSGIVDPVASDLGRVFAMDRGSQGYRLAADLLLGRDLYGADFMAAFRRGELAAVSA